MNEPQSESPTPASTNAPGLDAEKFLLAEYTHALQEMTRYDNDSTKISQLLALWIFGTSFFSSNANSEVLFGFLPFLAALAGFLLASNQFAYAAREKYIVEIEKMVAKFALIGPRFYSIHASSFWHSNRFTLNIFLPIRGALLLINGLLFAVLILGTVRTLNVLILRYEYYWQACLGAVIITVLWFIGSMCSSRHRLAQVHIKLADSANARLGKLLH